MKDFGLYKSPVIFEPVSHTYTLNGELLSGITSILSKYVFPNMYKDVPDPIKKKAGEKGSLIHDEIHNIISNLRGHACTQFLETATPETKLFFQTMKKDKLKFIASEYLVDNGSTVASMIDLVDSDYNLWDIKTYKTCDAEKRESARWQLSIYKYLFELNNPDKEVGKLFIFHINGDVCEKIEVQPIGEEAIIHLLNTFAMGLESFSNPLAGVTADDNELMREFLDVHEKAAAYARREKEIKESIKKHMTKNKSGYLELSGIGFSIGMDKETTEFDLARFMEEKPAIYKKYLKPAVTKGKFTVSFGGAK